jgi:hypothetical protein
MTETPQNSKIMRNEYKPLDKVRTLLKKRYDIDLEDYWTLTEDEKTEITEIIQTYYDELLLKQPELYSVYLHLLKESLIKSDLREDYEQSDMIKRSIEKLKEVYLEEDEEDIPEID